MLEDLFGYSASDIENSSHESTEKSIGAINGINYVGGLVGLNYLMGNITNSLNTGIVAAMSDEKMSNIGGICGLNNATISNCYNSGKIELDGDYEKAGGICGQNLSDSFVYTSYNIGKIVGENVGGAIGANFGEVTNTFYLDSSVNNGIDTEYSREENFMKTEILLDLGEEYKEDVENKNNGYPVLSWQ